MKTETPLKKRLVLSRRNDEDIEIQFRNYEKKLTKLTQRVEELEKLNDIDENEDVDEDGDGDVDEDEDQDYSD